MHLSLMRGGGPEHLLWDTFKEGGMKKEKMGDMLG